MNKTRTVTFLTVVSLAAIMGMSLSLAELEAKSCCGNHSEAGKMSMERKVKPKDSSLDQIHAQSLPMVSKSIDEAIKAVESGDKKTALAELQKAQKVLAAISEAIGRHVKPKFVNDRCPIMGSPINPEKVAKNLIRDYKGQKVAFCCAGCPSKWDKLSAAEKEAKLAGKTNRNSLAKDVA